MARAAKATKTTKPVGGRRKPGRPAGITNNSAAKVTKSSALPETVVRSRVAAVTTVPKLSKDELRAQVEKLERANAVLRAKGRASNKAAKADAARIAELELRVVQIEKSAARKPASAKAAPESKSAASTSSKRKSRSVDPGSAVPPFLPIVA